MNSRELKRIIRADLFRYFGKTSLKYFLKAYFTVPGFRFSYYLRKCGYYRNKGKGYYLCYIFYKLILRHYRYKFGFEISEYTKIGLGFCIGHFGGVVINPAASLGNNVSVGQGVLIGKNHRGEKAGAPIVENGVFLAAHCIIVGSVVIGKNSLIGPGAYVNFDVPESSIVIGNPGQIVSNKGVFGGYDEKYFYE